MAFRTELAVAIILITAALILHLLPIVKILLISSVFMILIVKLLNTGIEAVVNQISTEKYPYTGGQ